MLPKAIMFDMDDTIISFDGVCEAAWDKVCKDFTSNTGMFETKKLVDTIHEMREWYWSDETRHRIGRLNLDEARRDVVRLAFKELGVSNDEQAVELADNYTKTQEEMIYIFPKAEETLHELTKRGVKLALITNGNTIKQRAKIDRFNLERFFNICLVEGEVGFGKPDIRVYELALEKLEVDAREAWMVGDNLVWDVGAPQKLGIYSIWNDYRRIGLSLGSKIIPDRIINDISELI